MITVADVVRLSPFVCRSLASMFPEQTPQERLTSYQKMLEVTPDMAMFERCLQGKETPEAIERALRLLRRQIIVTLAGQDALHIIGYETVVRVMSDFAQFSIQKVVQVHARALAERHGVPMSANGIPQDLMVVGMGKLGGRELNVSSDIDLIFVYDEDGQTEATPEYPLARRTVSVQNFFERLARRIIPALNNVQGEGFVFRVDMRLRPNGESGAIVCSIGMLEEYLYTQGRDWERFAWLKGRIVSEPVFADADSFRQQTRALESLIRPFVYRKYLDFGAIESLNKLHEMIRAETARRELARGDTGVNIKLGLGGIREIEFLTQTLQVIRGGRDPMLRGRSTLPMLDALAQARVISESLAQRLKIDYVFLRNVEHAIQYVNDEQTHMLPLQGGMLENIAGLLSTSPEALWEKVQAVRERVSAAFGGIFQVKTSEDMHSGQWPIGWDSGTQSGTALLENKLKSLGYARDVDDLTSRIVRLVSGRRGTLSDTARERMVKLIPMIAEGCCQWQAPEGPRLVPLHEVLSRYLSLLEAIAGRSTYVSLLTQYPEAANRVGRVLGASRWCADYLVRHPIVLDELIDDRTVQINDFTPVDWSHWTARLRRAMAAADGDQERQMNILRDAHHAALFQLLTADLAGRFTLERLADQLSALADAVVQEVLELAWDSMKRKHRERPKFAVIAYGKLGGKELGYDSDLDLVFLSDDDDPQAGITYNRLVRRMMSWLTLQTSSGKLFEVDLRLRPNGESGLPVTPLEMFSRYMRNADGNGAWFWEWQALTRARFVAGDPELGRCFERERRAVLTMQKDRAQAREQVVAMREKMAQGHPNHSPWFDVKHDEGGMVDVEFVVQYMVLTYACTYPELVNNFGNILLLDMCAERGLIAPELSRDAAAAYRKYRTLQHEIRLNAGEAVPVRVPPQTCETERKAVRRLWQSVFSQANGVA